MERNRLGRGLGLTSSTPNMGRLAAGAKCCFSPPAKPEQRNRHNPLSLKMAYQSPHIFQDENRQIHIAGKALNRQKSGEILKPGIAARQERRALRDVSNTNKPPFSVVPKGSAALNEKSTTRGLETAKKAFEDAFLSDEDKKKCYELAKEGIEHMHYFDEQKFLQDQMEQSVEREVEEVLSYLNDWLYPTYPLVEVVSDIDLELEPEDMLPPHLDCSYKEESFEDPQLDIDTFSFVEAALDPIPIQYNLVDSDEETEMLTTAV